MKKSNPYIDAHSREFIKHFPAGKEVEIDQFDMFIIDRGMATDPETDDTKSIAYKGFVQERNAAKRALNYAACKLGEESYSIIVKTPGQLYEVMPFAHSVAGSSMEIATKVDKFIENKTSILKREYKKVEELARDYPDTEHIEEVRKMVEFTEACALELQMEVSGQVARFNRLTDVMESELQAFIETVRERQRIQ